MQNQYYSNGKLLISGEYLVLQGAKALAVPLKFGQDLIVRSKPAYKNAKIFWKSYVGETLWFEMSVSLENFSIHFTSDILIANRLLKLIKNALVLNPSFLNTEEAYFVSTNLNFDKDWGWGSSSTLVNNIASWARVNPYVPLKTTFDGSGYDIACANAEGPLFYQLSEDDTLIESVTFWPTFKENIYFLYLGKKQSSNASVKAFKELGHKSTKTIQQISDLSEEFTKADNLVDFQKLLIEHEQILSGVLKKKRIKEELFPDFNGEVKSLGAWGGDFVMIASDITMEAVNNYFEEKGLKTLFTFAEIIK